MSCAWNIIFMPPLIVIAGLFWGCVGALLWLVADEWNARRKQKMARR